jgi:hypothetical protein
MYRAYCGQVIGYSDDGKAYDKEDAQLQVIVSCPARTV